MAQGWFEPQMQLGKQLELHSPTPSGQTPVLEKRRDFTLPGGFYDSTGQTKDTAGEHLTRQIDPAHQVDWQANLNLILAVF